MNTEALKPTTSRYLRCKEIEHIMPDIIQSRLEASRKELLDLGLRNPLLNYKISKGKGVHIADERSRFIFDILVRQQKSMTFLALKEGALFPLNEDKYQDTRLQTEDDEQKLQARLLNTYYFSRTSIEEQGVNLLFLSLGMLHCYDPGDPEVRRSAPLVLVPVSLERSSAQERFRLRYTGSEIGANLSLQAKMKSDFNLTINDLTEIEEFDFDAYMEDVGEHTSRQGNWSVEPDAIELGFFSFGKFLVYNDLDIAKWPKHTRPEDHPNIQALFGEGFHEDLPVDEDDLDADTKANELIRVVDADSSQLMAMLAVQNGSNLVIQGPPGTGKSQTITNIIANAIGQGKKVLFVAEKMAALDVVKRRLDNIELGVACLELHSHKTNKRDVLNELKRVMELGKPMTAQLELEIQLLDKYRQELNAYCRAVNHQLLGSGLSAQEVMGFLLHVKQASDGREIVKLPIENLDSWDAAHMQTACEITDRIQAKLKDIGTPGKLLFYGSRLPFLLQHDKEELLHKLREAHRQVESLLTFLADMHATTGFTIPASEQDVPALEDTLAIAASAPDLSGLNLTDHAWYTKAADIAELLAAGQELETIYRTYKDVFVAEAWSQDILEIRRNIVVYGDKWYRGTIGSYRKSKQQLAALLKVTLPTAANDKLKMVDAISEARRLENRLNQYDTFAAALFGKRWLKQQSDWYQLTAAATYLAEHHDPVLLAYVQKQAPVTVAQNLLASLRSLVTAGKEKNTVALDGLQMDLFTREFPQQERTWKEWIDRFAELQLIMDWNQLSQQAEKEGLALLVKAAVEWIDAKDMLKISLQKSWYEHLIAKAFNLSPELSWFERTGHEEVISKFKKLDQVNLFFNRAKVALKHWEGLPKQNAGGQVNILKTEFNKKARHMPIRKLVEVAGNAIQAVKPVWMMSPMSIANFLPPGTIEFDLVIFDEASQVRPVDAIGAITRGKQLVVVGDTRQLPPTSFFDRLNTDVEDEDDNVTADLQSILGMCDGQGAPNRMLRWHYRSRHESLITLSNHEFYEDKLVIFPSPGSKQNLGLRFHHLPHAVYERGKTRTNPLEAAAVAKAIVSHAAKSPAESLGVVAFSTAQAQAIQAALETERKANPATEAFFASHHDEPFFIKNLENVQGDERDVILISIGYGKTEDGKISMNFGPLNNDGGERRLNVLITRAKMRCEVFTNVTADDLRLTDASKTGIRALKSFLYFAQYARLDSPAGAMPGGARPFEQQVEAALTRAGYTVRSRVGSPGFYLDLAVVDPEHPGRYLLGIECDGHSYASASSATDRDRLRTQVLEAFGWKLYRVWSTEWYRNPSRELDRLLAAVEEAKNMLTEADTVEQEALQLDLVRDNLVETAITAEEYKLAEIHIDRPRDDFNLYTFAEIITWLEEVVAVESPIHQDEAIKRITDAAGVKAGSRVKYSITQALKQAEQEGRITLKGDFLWLPAMDQPILRDRSKLPAPYRKLSLIAPEEIYLAIKQVVANAIAIDEQEAIPLIAKMLGFSRVTDEMRQELSAAIGKCIQLDVITFQGTKLRVV